MRLWLSLAAAALILAAVLIVKSLPETQAADRNSLAATYSHATLHVTIPYQGLHAGAGPLTVEVLDPEDHVLGRSERSVSPTEGKGSWRENIQLAKAVPMDEIVWHRLRYRFTYGGQREPALEGTESISAILRTPVIHVLGQRSYLAGGRAAVRVIVTDSKNETIAGSSSVRIALLDREQKARALFTGRLNRRGTTEAQFGFPAGLTGNYSLRYAVDTPLGSAEFTEPVRLEDKVSVLLTTEKPIYQPGQTIHVRALALDRANHAAASLRKLTFEVEDSRGNKVFKKATQTDRFGIASAEFALAEEVNLGTYHLRAVMDENRAEIALNVERYVLPKFKVAVEFAGKDQKTKRGYRPGDHVTGTVRANYFFGKPVDGEVTVKASAMDVAVFDVGSVQGKTGRDGSYRFDLTLPNYFAGRPLSQGAARVLIEATVKDSASHAETRGEPITVSESPLIVTAVPEGGTVVPGLENQVFVLTSYPDGTPATADVVVHADNGAGQAAATDAGGVAVVRVAVPAGAGATSLRIDAHDREGSRASASVQLAARPGSDQVLLRTERAVYRAGDPIDLRVFSTKERGTVYVDVVKDGQTVLTRDLDIVKGRAELSLAAAPELAGTVDISAYLFGRDARPVADHRLIFVQPADELKIEAATDRPVYKPGEDARIRFRVTNARGEGVEAALGLQVVDEAVFALAEKQPGFAKVFFYLEQEAMKPRYEIHSIGMPDIVQPTAAAGQRDRAARALFAATEMVNPNKLETEFGREVPRAKYAEYYGRYQAQFYSDLRRQGAKLVKAGGSGLRDAWGTGLRVEHVPWNPRDRFYYVRSAGPDKRFDTGDDLLAYVEVRPGQPVRMPGEGSFDLNIEHDRGPFNGLAEIVGTVRDATGAVVPQADITVREISTGKTRAAKANAIGEFALAAVPPGRYSVQVAMPGFRALSREVTLAARDRAVIAATLAIGAVSETVVVTAIGVGVGNGMGGGGGVFRMRAGGNVGGVVGGVLGGIVNAAPAAPMAIMEQMGLASKTDSFTRTDGTHLGTGSQKDAAALFAPAAGLTVRDQVGAAPRVRSYFPEALYINPEIITDHNGNATIEIPLADSITTWRMAMLASTPRGALGSGASSIKVFQDFFVDLDLPVTLTQGDRVSIPVAVYNYSGARGDVRLALQQDDWFSLVEDVADKALAVDSGRVGGASFTLQARRIGKFKLTLAARMNGMPSRADIVVREIEVIPDGREQNIVFNGRLETAVRHEVNFPPAAIPEASTIFVRLYPGPLSQVIEGMDAILRMPFGCFEQTSSATYPNVLALDYMKRTKKLTPEVHAKAEGFIANGYQRLLTFEVPGGGFSWFGRAPANKILTAYGLMEFSDMAKVHDVDPRLIQRTQQWLGAQQQADGSWKPDTSFINEGATNRYNSSLLRITAYIGWALENTGYRGPAVEKARQFVTGHMAEKADAYTLAVAANFAAEYGLDRAFMNQAAQMLLDARTEKDDQAWWSAEETGVYATGASAAVETTGLAVQALLKWGGAPAVAEKALRYLAAKKDANGTWGTTQATIMALRALLLSTEKGAADVRGTLEVSLDGRPVQNLTLTPENNDLLHQFVFKGIDAQAAHEVGIRFTGKGGLAYQVVGRYFQPWDEKPAREPLSITVNYDRTRLAQDDIATASATIRNNLPKAANMVMVDLGIPPGFDLLSEDLQDFQAKSAGRGSGCLEKFNLTATQAILYFNSIGAGDTVTLRFRLRAKYPIRARTLQSRVYEYYDPEVSAIARPVRLEVTR